jgi:hypothetical protein
MKRITVIARGAVIAIIAAALLALCLSRCERKCEEEPFFTLKDSSIDCARPK